MTFELGIQHQGLGPYKIYSNDDSRFTMTYFTVDHDLLYSTVNFSPECFCMGKCLNTRDFIETIEVYELKTGTNSCLSET